MLLDRSVFSDCVFADVNYQEGTISEEGKYFFFLYIRILYLQNMELRFVFFFLIFLGYRYYNDLKSKALRCLPIPSVLVYIDASPDVCFERIHGRGRVRILEVFAALKMF